MKYQAILGGGERMESKGLGNNRVFIREITRHPSVSKAKKGKE